MENSHSPVQASFPLSLVKPSTNILFVLTALQDFCLASGDHALWSGSSKTGEGRKREGTERGARIDDQDCRLRLLSSYNFAVGTGLGDSTLLEGKPCFPFHSVTTHFTQKHPSS